MALRVVLIRAGAVTHAFDMEQRLVGLSFTGGTGVLKAQAPANGNLAPPGYYLLFIVNKQGTPSVGQFVHLKSAPAKRKR
ncbi:MAG TPA: galactose oxidase early set domain-containing protein [Thermoanaerobaculia bacterium]